MTLTITIYLLQFLFVIIKRQSRGGLKVRGKNGQYLQEILDEIQRTKLCLA